MYSHTEHSLDPLFDELHRLAQVYQAPAALPSSVPELVSMLYLTAHEIAHMLQEGHAPFHKEVPYRLAYLTYKACHLELAGLPRPVVRGLLAHLLAEIGFAEHHGVMLALHRYRQLCAYQQRSLKRTVHEELLFTEQVDELELVPLLQRLLQGK